MKKIVKPGEAEAVLNALGLETLCDRLVSGETQTAICKSLGITKGSLGRWISLDAERQARVREARIEAAQAYDDLAEEAIKKARGKDGIAKARELAHHYRWRASKANPREFGEKLEIDQQTTIINLSDEEIERRMERIRSSLAAAQRAREPSDGQASQ